MVRWMSVRRDIDDADDLAWLERAGCRGEDTELFFGPAAERPESRGLREDAALEVCDRCEVRRECIGYARRNREYGVWGETETDRINAGHAPDMPIGLSARRARLVRAGMIAT